MVDKNRKLYFKCIGSEQANVLQTETNFTHIRSPTIAVVNILKSAVQKSDIKQILDIFCALYFL